MAVFAPVAPTCRPKYLPCPGSSGRAKRSQPAARLPILVHWLLWPRRVSWCFQRQLPSFDFVARYSPVLFLTRQFDSPVRSSHSIQRASLAIPELNPICNSVWRRFNFYYFHFVEVVRLSFAPNITYLLLYGFVAFCLNTGEPWLARFEISQDYWCNLSPSLSDNFIPWDVHALTRNALFASFQPQNAAIMGLSIIILFLKHLFSDWNISLSKFSLIFAFLHFPLLDIHMHHFHLPFFFKFLTFHSWTELSILGRVQIFQLGAWNERLSFIRQWWHELFMPFSIESYFSHFSYPPLFSPYLNVL